MHGDVLEEDLSLFPTQTDDDIVTLIESRFAADLPYTLCGTVCVCINPYRWLPLYDTSVIQSYKEDPSRRVAHPYAIAAQAWSGVQQSKSQCIVVTGNSGSGKTETTRICMQFLASSQRATTVVEKVILAGEVLEFFGNAETTHNPNSSRYGKMVQLHCAQGDVRSASMHTWMLERSRVAQVREGEGGFRVMYAVLDDEEISNLYALCGIDRKMIFERTTPATPSRWENLRRISHTIGMSFDSTMHVSQTVAAILFILMRDFSNASHLLGVDVTVLTKCVHNRKIDVGNESVWSPCDVDESKARIKSIAMNVYCRMFDIVVEEVNSCLARPTTNCDARATLGILDIFGFEIMARNGLEQLCINYCNEHLHSLFVEQVILLVRKEYLEQGILHVDDRDCTETTHRPNAVVRLCETTLFRLLDECLKIQTKDANDVVLDLTRRVEADTDVRHAFRTRRAQATVASFSINHFAGVVEYDATHFVESNSDDLRTELVEMLASSSKAWISRMFANDGVVRKTRPVSVTSAFRAHMHKLLDVIRDSNAWYVRCMSPNGRQQPRMFDTQWVRAQVVACGLLETCQIMREGFDVRMEISRFCRRFSAADHSGVVVGKTMLYMSRAVFERVQMEDATHRIQRSTRRHIALVRRVVRIQRSVRRYMESVCRARHEAAARVLQCSVRARRGHLASWYRMTPARRLVHQIEHLREEVRTRDEEIFRLRLMLSLQ